MVTYPIGTISEQLACRRNTLIQPGVNDVTLPSACLNTAWNNQAAIADNAGSQWRYKGYSFMDGTMGRTSFNTLLPPNKLCCVFTGGAINAAIKPLSSYHPGGVNAAFADGSVRFFKETVNPQTTALGLATPGKSYLPTPTEPAKLAHTVLSSPPEASPAECAEESSDTTSTYQELAPVLASTWLEAACGAAPSS